MALHVIVEILLGAIDHCAVIGIAIPVFKPVEVLAPGSSDNYASVGPGNEIVKVPVGEAEAIRV